jgi:predicted TIM-barrel fold metal-dependent hydrolase
MEVRQPAQAGRALLVTACLAGAALCSSCSLPKAPGAPSTIAGNDSVTLFDHHVHVLSPALVERWKIAGVPFSKPDYAYSNIDSIRKFDPASGMFLVSMAYLWSTPGFSDTAGRSNVARENDFVAGLARTDPGRLFAFCAVDPLTPYAVEELVRCRREKGAYGLKLHFAISGIDLSNPVHLARVREVLAAASSEGMPVLLHLPAPSEGAGDAAAALFIDSVLVPGPPIELTIAHLGTPGGYGFATSTIVRRFSEALGSLPELRKDRLWFDLSAVALTGESEEVPALTAQDFTDLASDLRGLGLERVVFGTDYPAFNSVAYMGLLESELPLTRDELIRIAGNGTPPGFGPARP